MRQSTGLKPFSWNEQLAKSAQNHANYLTLNQQHGHYEQAGRALFTGEWVTERALATHYPNRMVSENVTSKSGDLHFYKPLDSLMSAIYHRFGFLDLTKNEIGIGHQTGTINSYVYVMGNKKLTKLCQLPEFTQNGVYNYKICPQTNKRIDKRLVDHSKRQSLLENPPVILWPADKAQNIPPAFFQESPDPLPHHSVSGYPVSVQFNPAYFKKEPKVTAFSLQKSNSNKPVKTITILHKDNDPNHVFTAFQHALFPQLRLDWNTQYTAHLSYINQDTLKTHTLIWSFSTQKFDAPIITIKNQHTISVTQGKTYVLYFPPQHANDIQASLKYRETNMQLKLNYIDNNTLNAYIGQNGYAHLTFHNKTITLTTD